MGPARQTELSRWVYRRCRDGPVHRRRAKPTHARGPKERQPARGCRGDEAPGRAPWLVRPRFARARTRHKGPWEVMYTGAGP